MTTRMIDRLLFAQGGRCFFCQCLLTLGEASVEHLVASSNGGSNDPNNCVVCCKALNALLGSMSLKEKFQVILNQKGQFKCPSDRTPAPQPPVSKLPVLKLVVPKQAVPKTAAPAAPVSKLALVIADLRKRGTALPTTVQSLSRTISALFQKKITENEIASLLKKLQTQGIIYVNGTKVTYVISAIHSGHA